MTFPEVLPLLLLLVLLLLLLLLLLPITILLTLALLSALRLGPYRVLHAQPGVAAVAHDTRRLERRRARLAIVVAAVTGPVSLSAAFLLPWLAQGSNVYIPLQLLLLGPLLTAGLGVLTFASLPIFREAPGPRSAELVRRGVRSVPVSGLGALAVHTALVLLAAAAFVLKPLLYRFTKPGFGPVDWLIREQWLQVGLPTVILLGLLLAVSLAAIARLARVPQPSERVLRDADAARRAAAAGVVLSATSAGVLGALTVLVLYVSGDLVPLNGAWPVVSLIGVLAPLTATLVYTVRAVVAAWRPAYQVEATGPGADPGVGPEPVAVTA